MTDIKTEIKEKQKQASITIKLTADELTRLKLEAIKAGMGDNYQDYARRQFREKVTQSLIGSPTIGVGTKGLVTGPSKQVGSDYAC